jgi:hypothetical protein
LTISFRTTEGTRTLQAGDKKPKKRQKKAGILGLGLDCDDGHTRLTRGDNFLLMGGSQDTHQVMQETAIKINEHLGERGKRLEDVTPKELREIVCRVHEQVHGRPLEDEH